MKTTETAKLNAMKKAELVAMIQSMEAEAKKPTTAFIVIDKDTKVSVEVLNAKLNSIRSKAGQVKAKHSDSLPAIRELDGGSVKLFTLRALPILKEKIDKGLTAELRASGQIVAAFEKLGLC